MIFLTHTILIDFYAANPNQTTTTRNLPFSNGRNRW